jgi:hypothetical protein
MRWQFLCCSWSDKIDWLWAHIYQFCTNKTAFRAPLSPTKLHQSDSSWCDSCTTLPVFRIVTSSWAGFPERDSPLACVVCLIIMAFFNRRRLLSGCEAEHLLVCLFFCFMQCEYFSSLSRSVACFKVPSHFRRSFLFSCLLLENVSFWMKSDVDESVTSNAYLLKVHVLGEL